MKKLKYKIQDMHERPVVIRPISKSEIHAKCTDCGGLAKFHVFELASKFPQFANWYWCGVCDIGV
jgi:hypothetical protein